VREALETFRWHGEATVTGDAPLDNQARALCERFQERQRRGKFEPIAFPPDWEQARANMALASRIMGNRF
jgi:hypothetical protein